MMTDDEVLAALSQRDATALTMLGEAANQPLSGLACVGETIRNRQRSSYRGTTYKSVCLWPKQYSCWNKDEATYPQLLKWARQLIENPSRVISNTVTEAQWLADGLMNGTLRSRMPLTTRHYARTDAWLEGRVSWDRQRRLIPVASVGDHSFFRDVP